MGHAKESLDQPRQGPSKVLLNPATLRWRQTRNAGSNPLLRIDDGSDDPPRQRREANRELLPFEASIGTSPAPERKCGAIVGIAQERVYDLFMEPVAPLWA